MVFLSITLRHCKLAAAISLAALLLGGTRLSAPKPPRRLGESLARPLRARRRPPRNHRVWAADVCGCYDRSRIPTFALVHRPRPNGPTCPTLRSVFLSAACVCVSAISSFISHHSSFFAAGAVWCKWLKKKSYWVRRTIDISIFLWYNIVYGKRFATRERMFSGADAYAVRREKHRRCKNGMKRMKTE